MSEPYVLREDHEGGVVRLVLNRPANRNALSSDMMAALAAALTAIETDRAARVAILAGQGPAFCAGHDLRELRAMNDRDTRLALLRQCSAMMTQIVRLPKPVIAEVQAIATAAGCQLVASCDLAIAAEGVTFATPGVNLGLFCSTPMVALSRNVAPKHAMEMLLTGDLVDAATAQRFGLINRIVPAADLRDATLALARQIASKSTKTVAIGKRAFYDQLPMTLDDAYAYCSEVMATNLEALDAQEGIGAFIDKRPPVWRDA